MQLILLVRLKDEIGYDVDLNNETKHIKTNAIAIRYRKHNETKMIKKYFTFILLTAMSLGQPKPENKPNILQPKEVVLKPTGNITIAKPDTVKLNNLSTTPTTIPIDKTKDTRIVLVKDVAKEDYSKYIISIISILVGFFLNKVYEWWNDRKLENRASVGLMKLEV